MLEAVRVAEVPTGDPNVSQVLWKLSSSIKYTRLVEHRWSCAETEYVITSATTLTCVWGFPPETYIFPANAEGKIMDCGELAGSFKGALDHERAINGLLDEYNKKKAN